MAIKHGKEGSVSVTGITVGIKDWSLDISADTPDSTTFDDTDDWRVHVVGLKTASGSFGGFINTADLPDVDVGTAIVNLDLYIDTDNTKYYRLASATITGHSPSVSEDGIETITYTFLANGAVTYPA